MTWDDEFFDGRRLTSKRKHLVLRRYVEKFAARGEPKFRELEPDWRMAQTGGGDSIRCLTAVDEH